MCLWDRDAESMWEGAWLEWQRVAVLIIVMVLNTPPMMLTVTSQERLNMKLNCRLVLLYSAMPSGRNTYM